MTLTDARLLTMTADARVLLDVACATHIQPEIENKVVLLISRSTFNASIVSWTMTSCSPRDDNEK